MLESYICSKTVSRISATLVRGRYVRGKVTAPQTKVRRLPLCASVILQKEKPPTSRILLLRVVRSLRVPTCILVGMDPSAPACTPLGSLASLTVVGVQELIVFVITN
jgi:hypothetical protein